MDKRELLMDELERIPDALLDEVLTFVHTLKAKPSGSKLGTAIASESCLAKDWLKPEEDEAWSDL